MSRKIKIGKVVLTNGGTWNATTGYAKLTYVLHSGDGWWSVKANVNSEPSATNVNWIQATDTQSLRTAMQALITSATALETALEAAESLRVSAETARATAEASRVSSENARVQAENSRVSSENSRVDAESARVSSENLRVSQENARVQAERNRVSAETARETAATQAISNANAATNTANAAAATAQSASATATAASALANKAVEDANEVIETMNAKIATADTDHTRAEGDHSTATTDHSNAATDHTTAGTDHSLAASDHSTAASDHTAASTDHSNATADHTQAASDHSTAASDHETAQSDHTLAVADHTNMGARVTSLETEVGDLRELETEAHGSLVEAINEVYGYAFEEDGHVYGVRHYYNQASPILTRFQTSQLHDLHQLLPVQSLMRRCILKDNGEVAYYLDHADSTKKEDGTDAVLDGTDGMVMVEIPTHYRKHTLVENADDASLSYYESAISLLPFSGAMKVNKCYISAYEAAIDRTNNKLASVCNNTARYRGGNNNADWDGTNKTLLGRPASVQSLTSFRNLARARGSMWNCQELDIYNTLYWLYTIEYANLNCQAAYNENRDGSGRHQGGLGDGVTNMPNWDQWSYYPIVPCGVTNTLGNATGVVTHNVMKADGETIHYAAKVPSYRGVENPFGHIWKWTDGFIAIGNGTKQEYYTCHDRSHYASSKNDYYTSKGLSAGNNGYVKDFIRNADGDVLCSAVGGGSTTYGCDYHYEAWNNGTTYGLRLGGDACSGAAAGFAYSGSHNAPSHAGAAFGSRLCWSLHNKIVE